MSGAQKASAGGGGTGNSLYVKTPRIHARYVKGWFRNVKWLSMAVLLGLYFGGPWLRWERAGGPDQAILIDLPGRRAYFFFIEIWPQEVYYLTGLLIIAAIGLFAATALLGRVWCGFACFQTVFTDLFARIEHLVQGDRNARLKLEKAPWTTDKAIKIGTTHVLWLIVSILTGYTFVIYFADAPQATMALLTGEASTAMYFFVALLTGFTYLMAGFAREQVCIYMCPYSRFQGAMYDEDSLIVTYEAWRGEPRGVYRQGQDFNDPDRGHCVDCKLCVHACPTGIDIRDGSQLACISCGLCIDACNTVMDRFGLPRNLITYDSINNQRARARGEPEPTRLLRPRILIYFGILLLVSVVMAYSLATRERLDMSVQHERNPLYVQLSDGSIRNGYTVRILNMVREQRTYRLSVEGLDQARLTVVGHARDSYTFVDLPTRPDTAETFRVYVTAPRASVQGASEPVVFRIEDLIDGREIRLTSLFAGPAP